MYSFFSPSEKNKYELSALAGMFLPASEFTFEDGLAEYDLLLDPAEDKNAQKRALYRFLSGKTGKDLAWGTLTGVRPSKLYNELSDKGLDSDSILMNEYFVSPEKTDLLKRVRDTQKQLPMDKDPKAIGIYIGIPFCPTRCLYCSFTSNQITKEAASAYVKALCKEIEAVKNIMSTKGYYAESIYIGGGTPTSLDDSDLETVLSAAASAFLSEKTMEFTVEAGRPDTITVSKLSLIRKYGAKRISINPQSMKQKTLDLIGRSHTPAQIIEAFRMAKDMGFTLINADLIAGLSEEGPEDLADSLAQIMALEPANITVHTLAVKKASRLIEQDPQYAFRQADTVGRMLEKAQIMLKEGGYVPYYLYRQKHMAGNFENVGYCKPQTASVYNIRIMEENQTIIALGAGGISKLYYSEENRLERVPNVSNYSIYIDRIDEMIERKEKGIL